MGSLLIGVAIGAALSLLVVMHEGWKARKEEARGAEDGSGHRV
jgi:gas vesicle protein